MIVDGRQAKGSMMGVLEWEYEQRMVVVEVVDQRQPPPPRGSHDGGLRNKGCQAESKKEAFQGHTFGSFHPS